MQLSVRYSFIHLFLKRLLDRLVIRVNKIYVVLGFLLVVVGKNSQTREKQHQDDQDHADSDIEGGVVSLIILNVSPLD